MKRLTIIISLVVLSISVFAQKEGEKYLAPSIFTSFGRQYVRYTNYLEHYNASKPLDILVTPSCEFAFFPLDNWRFAFAIGIPFYASPDQEYASGWEYDYIMAVTFNPNVAYYVRLTDHLYYTPEVGIKYEYGKESDSFSSIFSRTTPSYWGITAGVNLFGLEYRVSEKIAISVGISSIYYTFARESGSQYSSSYWQFGINNGTTVSALFYL